MNKKQVVVIAKKLVNTSIGLHKKKKLSKYSLNQFFNSYLKEFIDTDYYNYIIHEYCRILAEKGYEIKIDTEHFDIINFNSREYKFYIEELLSKLPKNYDELQKVAKLSATKIIKMYKTKKYINQSFQEYLDNVIPIKYTSKEKTTIQVGTVHYLTQNYYDIDNTNPLVLNKF